MVRIQILFLIALPVVLAGCAPAVLDNDLPFFGTGYRAEGDACLRVGENGFTNQFLSDSADLVGCPADMDDSETFVAQTGAVLVAELGTTNLYSVPLR